MHARYHTTFMLRFNRDRLHNLNDKAGNRPKKNIHKALTYVNWFLSGNVKLLSIIFIS